MMGIHSCVVYLKNKLDKLRSVRLWKQNPHYVFSQNIATGWKDAGSIPDGVNDIFH
jgi:hypothetical protein